MNNSKPTHHLIFEPLHPLSILLKISVIGSVAFLIKSSPMQPTWAIVMVLFAALFLVPIAFLEMKRAKSPFPMYRYGLVCQLFSAIFFAFSFLMERSTMAGIFSLPYAIWCMENFLHGVKINTKWVYLSTLITFGFLANAAIWLTFDRFGVQPFGFSSWIVILTGVHFHYAGFALMACLTLFLYQQPNDKFAQSIIFLNIVGVILTAIGITATQLGTGLELETFAGVWMALSAMLAGAFFIKKSFSEAQPTQTLWLLGGVCLMLAMILAGLYALRSVIPLEDLTIPFMQAIHGTTNALGFGTLMLLGWAFRKKTTQVPPQ
jgi:hypothetical protein